MYSAGQHATARSLLLFASPPLTYERRDVARQKQLLAEAFAGEEWEVPRMLDAMREAPDFYFDSVSQVHMDGWTRGRTALMGDAGYCPSPASGQGTSLALVGAYVLAGELEAAAGDHRVAFARYDAKLRPYVTQNLALGQKMAREMMPTSRGQLWLRSQLMRLLSRLPWKGLLAKGILEPIQKAANAITLEAY